MGNLRPTLSLVVTFLTAVLLPACGGAGAAPPTPAPSGSTRPFALGFTDFPYAFSLQAVNEVAAIVRRDGDLAVLHFDDGVPWAEALAGTPYPADLQADLERKAAALPAGHVRYVAITPIGFSRDRIAARPGGAPNPPPFDNKGFDDPDVIQAFLAHAEKLIALYRPDFFAYGIEVNILRQLAPAEWERFKAFAAAVYPRLKANHPTLPVFLTFQADFVTLFGAPQEAAIREVLPYTDLLAASAYPYEAQADPRAVPADLFDRVARLDPAKRFAVAETGWAAENVTAPYAKNIAADEELQRLYVERLLADATRLNAAFVCWFVARDYDDLWDTILEALPTATLTRLWKDTGLYAGDGRARPALASWRNALARPRR